MKLKLLIDTSVWLDMAKDPRHLTLLDALFAMIGSCEVELILPQIVVEEFARNRERVMASSRASLDRPMMFLRSLLITLTTLVKKVPTLGFLTLTSQRFLMKIIRYIRPILARF